MILKFNLAVLSLAGLALAAFGSPAIAQVTAAAEPAHPKLKAEAVVNGDVVRVGDLVANAGIIADVPIFRAPDLGATGAVSAEAVREAVRAHALVGLDTGGISEVAVTRASRAIPADEIERCIAHALAAQYSLGPAKDIVLAFDSELRALQVEPAAKGEPRVARLTYEPRSGRFSAVVDIPAGTGARAPLRLYGRATATVEVATLVRTLERGAVIRESDVLFERRARAEIGRDAVTEHEHVVGQAARVTLEPGRPLRTTQLMKPQIVQRGESVTLVYEVPGITLTVRGKATEGGAEGDVIMVLNEQSKRTIQGVVAGPGRVVVSTKAPRVAANLPPGEPDAKDDKH